MTNGLNLDQVEVFLRTVDRETLSRAHDETVYGNADSAFCVCCAEEYDDINFRASDGCQCVACGEMAVYPVEDLFKCCEQLGSP